ncbi:MAG: HAMP domain-containing sensor histidine kinase [Rubrivivax sp.]
MTVRFKIALTIFITGALTALGVVGVVLGAFQRFEHESNYYRANGFLQRVVQQHSDLFEMHQRHPREFKEFLRNLVLFEPDTQLYLLDADGTVLASSGETKLAADFKVTMAPVREAASGMPMPYVMGDDPERMATNTVIAAQPLRHALIRNGEPVAGYLYLVCHKTVLPEGRVAALRSSFTLPALAFIIALVAMTSLLAAWIIGVVTRPLRQLTQAVATVAREGLDAGGAASAAQALLPALPARDEFGQLAQGFRSMLAVLRSQWETLRRLDHFRREGVSNLSHDLRSPLTATAACLETLETRWRGDAERAEDRKLLEVALRNTRNTARLVQSLGELAQLDEPHFKMRSEVLDMRELLDDIALRFTPRASAAGVTVTADPSGDTPVFAAVDIELFERAVANLVENALKYCHQGERITLSALHHQDQVRVSVADSGAGISSADVPHLFDRFYQSRQGVAPATGDGGKGLGLAIVKRIAELHGGSVSLISDLGVGTTVTLSLPAAAHVTPA